MRYNFPASGGYGLYLPRLRRLWVMKLWGSGALRPVFLQEVRLLVLQFPLPPSRSRPQYAIHFLVVAERRGVGSSCPAHVLLRVFRVSVGVRLSMSTSHFFSMPLSHLVFLPPRPSPPPGYGFTTVCLALPRALPPSAAVRRFFYLSFGNEDTISGQDTP